MTKFSDASRIPGGDLLNRRAPSLRLKVMVMLLLLSLAPLSLMTFLNYRTTSRSLKQAASQSLASAASETALNLDAFVSAKLTSIGIEAKLPMLTNFLLSPKAESARETLESLRSMNRQDPIFIVSTALLDIHGKNILDTNPRITSDDESKTSFFRNTMETGLPSFSPVIFSPKTGNPFIALSAPVMDRGRIVGVLRTLYSARVLQQIIVGTTGLAGPQSFAVLLDDNNLILAYGQSRQKADQFLFHFAAPLPEYQRQELSQIQRIPRDPGNPVAFDDPTIKEAAFGSEFTEGDLASVTAPMRNLPWRVSFLIPTSSFMLPVRMQARQALLLLAGIASAVALVAFWNSRVLFDPLRHLTHMASRVATGDLDAKVPVESSDEIGLLASTFNAMTRQLKEREQERDLLLSREQAARAEAEQANKLKDDFLATLSHELRTPLTAILGWINLLKRNPSEAELHEGLAVVERNAWAESQLVDDLLDISRITQGKITLNRDALDFDSVIAEAIDAVSPAAQARQIELQTRLPAENICVTGDWNRLRQVVLNLLNNAIKFTQDGGRVILELKEMENRVILKVIDNGIGIKPEHLGNIFTRFMQVDSSSTRRFGGMGLGLAIARHLVELHGGTIRAESEGEGKGTTFTVELPAMKSCEEIPERLLYETPSLPAHARPPDSLEKVRVLVVDDDNDTLKMLRQIFADAGAEVFTATNSPEAVDQFRQNKPDLLLSDIGLPGEDGYRLLERIRKEPGKGATIPAIALTAFATTEDTRRAREAGFQIHFAKPIQPEKLVALVASMTHREEG